MSLIWHKDSYIPADMRFRLVVLGLFFFATLRSIFLLLSQVEAATGIFSDGRSVAGAVGSKCFCPVIRDRSECPAFPIRHLLQCGFGHQP